MLLNVAISNCTCCVRLGGSPAEAKDVVEASKESLSSLQALRAEQTRLQSEYRKMEVHSAHTIAQECCAVQTCSCCCPIHSDRRCCHTQPMPS